MEFENRAMSLINYNRRKFKHRRSQFVDVSYFNNDVISLFTLLEQPRKNDPLDWHCGKYSASTSTEMVLRRFDASGSVKSQ